MAKAKKSAVAAEMNAMAAIVRWILRAGDEAARQRVLTWVKGQTLESLEHEIEDPRQEKLPFAAEQEPLAFEGTA